MTSGDDSAKVRAAQERGRQCTASTVWIFAAEIERPEKKTCNERMNERKSVSVEALVVGVVAPADEEENERNHNCDQHPGAHQIENPPEERRPAARLRRVVHSRTHRLRAVRIRHPAGSWCWHLRLLLLPQQRSIVNRYNSANCNIFSWN